MVYSCIFVNVNMQVLGDKKVEYGYCCGYTVLSQQK